jgi:hypothetical protein
VAIEVHAVINDAVSLAHRGGNGFGALTELSTSFVTAPVLDDYTNDLDSEGQRLHGQEREGSGLGAIIVNYRSDKHGARSNLSLPRREPLAADIGAL